MKKIIIFSIAIMTILSLAACNDQSTDTTIPQDSKPGTSQTDITDETDAGNVNIGSEKCVFCLDMKGNDRKCDECGNWIHEKGEVWTKEVPENLKASLTDHLNNYYTIEKIGDELYIKYWLNEKDYNENKNFSEEHITMTEHYNRNGEGSEWRENGFPIKYGDVYELFAIKVMQNLTGSALSSTVESCLEAPAVGNEIVAGKDCVIKEYDGNFGIKYKVWMWNNIPLKKAQIDTNTDEDYKTMYEFSDWNTDITAFSVDLTK